MTDQEEQLRQAIAEAIHDEDMRAEILAALNGQEGAAELIFAPMERESPDDLVRVTSFAVLRRLPTQSASHVRIEFPWQDEYQPQLDRVLKPGGKVEFLTQEGFGAVAPE